MIRGADKLIVDVLESYKSMLAADTPESDTEWDRVLGADEPGGLSSADVAKARDAFRARPPRVTLAFPRRNGPWPLWCVILAEASPHQEYGGKMGEPLDDLDNEGEVLEVLSMQIEQSVMVAVHVEHSPDLCRIHADLIMAAMLEGRDYLLANGMDGYGFNGGADLAPDPQILPEQVFVRAQTWTCSVSVSKARTPGWTIVRPALVGLDVAVVDEAGHQGGVTPSATLP